MSLQSSLLPSHTPACLAIEEDKRQDGKHQAQIVAQRQREPHEGEPYSPIPKGKVGQHSMER